MYLFLILLSIIIMEINVYPILKNKEKSMNEIDKITLFISALLFITFDINNLYVTFYRFFIGLLGSLSVYFVIVKIYSSIKNLHIVHWMTSYGMYTMGIYLIHVILVKVLKLIFNFSRMDEIYIDLISLILSIFFVFIVVKILNIVNKNKVSRLLLLGKK